MQTYSYTGSFGYVVPLWILTGVLLLVMDAGSFRVKSMAREAKASKLLGWINISVGAVLLVLRWIV